MAACAPGAPTDSTARAASASAASGSMRRRSRRRTDAPFIPSKLPRSAGKRTLSRRPFVGASRRPSAGSRKAAPRVSRPPPSSGRPGPPSAAPVAVLRRTRHRASITAACIPRSGAAPFAVRPASYGNRGSYDGAATLIGGSAFGVGHVTGSRPVVGAGGRSVRHGDGAVDRAGDDDADLGRATLGHGVRRGVGGHVRGCGRRRRRRGRGERQRDRAGQRSGRDTAFNSRFPFVT